MKEIVICECLEEIQNLSAKATCTKCKREILSTQELKELQVELDSKAHDLNIQSAKITIELHLRNVRKPSRQYLVRDDFFAGVKGKRSEFTKKERNQQELKAEAMTLLQML